MTTWAAYTRVSTSHQAESGLGLEAQRAKLEAWATYNGVELRWFTDAGLTGKNTDRPELQAALAALDSGECSGLVVYKLCRLTRSTRDLLSLMDRFRDDGGPGFVSCLENLDTTSAMGRFVLTIMGAVNALEADLISERTKAALQAKRVRGEALGGRAPYGWRKAGACLAPVVQEQAAARRAKELHNSGESLRAVGRALAAEGYAPRGKTWNPAAVQRAVTADLVQS